jgi:hypothetical protein
MKYNFGKYIFRYQDVVAYTVIYVKKGGIVFLCFFLDFVYRMGSLPLDWLCCRGVDGQ